MARQIGDANFVKELFDASRVVAPGCQRQNFEILAAELVLQDESIGIPYSRAGTMWPKFNRTYLPS